MYLSPFWKDRVPLRRSLMGFPVRTAKNPVHTHPNSHSLLYYLRPTFASSLGHYVHFSLCDSCTWVLKLLETPISPASVPPHCSPETWTYEEGVRVLQGGLICKGKLPGISVSVLLAMQMPQFLEKLFFQITLIFKGLLGKRGGY